MSWLLDFSWVTERHVDLINRGSRRSTPLGKCIFVGLRTLDPFLQYSILAHGVGSSLLHRLGFETLPPGLPAQTGIALIDGLGLSPYRLILLGMTVGAAAKQAYWVTFVSLEEMPVKAAIEVASFNAVSNSINTLAFTAAALSASKDSGAIFPQAPLIAGSALYVVGLLLEWASECQRKKWKNRPENQGKPYTQGLWRFARHINYGGYVLWRAGFAMAGAGWGYGVFVGLFFLWDFSTRGVVVLDNYCSKKYGQQWEQFKKQTPYKLIPFLW